MLADCIPSANATAAQPLQYENASCCMEASPKLEVVCLGTPLTVAPTINCVPADRLVNSCGSFHELPSKVEEARDRAQGADICTKKKRGSNSNESYGGLKGSKEVYETDDKSHVNKASLHICNLVPSVCFNKKVQQMPNASPPCQRKRSTVIRLSYKRKSYDGEEITEFCT